MANDGLPCLGCGGRRSKGQTRCGPCAYARRKARGGYRGHPCVGCGVTVAGGTADPGEAMCRGCRASRRKSWESSGRACKTCGHVTPGRTRAECARCSLARSAESATPCSAHSCDRPSLAKGMCSSHYSWYWRALFGSTSGKGTWILPQRRLSIYERDGWMCGICGDPVDRAADAGADLAPSLDHIVPRSLGGGHESENLRTAHRVCNARRGANVEGVSHDEWASAVRDYRGCETASAEPGEVWDAV